MHWTGAPAQMAHLSHAGHLAWPEGHVEGVWAVAASRWRVVFVHHPDEGVAKLFVLVAVQDKVDRAVGDDHEVGDGEEDVHGRAHGLVGVEVPEDGAQLDEVDDELERVADKKDEDDEEEDGRDHEVPPPVVAECGQPVAARPDGHVDPQVEKGQAGQGDDVQGHQADDRAGDGVGVAGPELGRHGQWEKLVPADGKAHHLELEEPRDVGAERKENDGDHADGPAPRVKVDERVAHGEVALDGHGHGRVDRAGEGDLAEGKEKGDQVGEDAVGVAAAQVGHAENHDAEHDAERVENDERLEQLDKGGLQVELGRAEHHKRYDVAHHAGGPDDGHEGALQHELPDQDVPRHRVLVVVLVRPDVRRVDGVLAAAKELLQREVHAAARRHRNVVRTEGRARSLCVPVCVGGDGQRLCEASIVPSRPRDATLGLRSPQVFGGTSLQGEVCLSAKKRDLKEARRNISQFSTGKQDGLKKKVAEVFNVHRHIV